MTEETGPVEGMKKMQINRFYLKDSKHLQDLCLGRSIILRYILKK